MVADSYVSRALWTIQVSCSNCQALYGLTEGKDLKCSHCGKIPDVTCKYNSSEQNVPEIGDLDNQLEIIICNSCGLGQLFDHPWPMKSQACAGCKVILEMRCARSVQAHLRKSSSRATDIPIIEGGREPTDIPKSKSYGYGTCKLCWFEFDEPCKGDWKAKSSFSEEKSSSLKQRDKKKRATRTQLKPLRL